MIRSDLKRLLCVALALFCCLSAAACTKGDTSSEAPPKELDFDISGNVPDSAVVERAYTGLLAENTDLLNSNPNRGFRGFMQFKNYPSPDAVADEFNENVANTVKYVSTKSYIIYFYLSDYIDGNLDDNFFKCALRIFDLCREQKLSVIVRFAYWNANFYTTRYPTTADILRHIGQLSENGLIKKNEDVISAFSAGFIGQYGEWHSDNNVADRETVINAVIEQLLPEGMYLMLRMPEYRSFIHEDNLAKVRLAYNDDCYFGIQPTNNLGNQGYSAGMEQYEYQKTNGYNAPNDAECYVSHWFLEYGIYPDAYACLLGMYDHHLSTLSAENGYIDAGAYGSAIGRWYDYPVTEKWLEEFKLPYSKNWFLDKNGNTVEHNAFEFIRDYLGYRLSAKHLSVTEKSKGRLNIELSLENYGVNPAFNITSNLVILDADYNKFTASEAGDPSEWYAISPEDTKNKKQLTHTVSAELSLPDKAGQYYLALELRSKGGDTARLDNNIPYENGYNILHSFKVS